MEARGLSAASFEAVVAAHLRLVGAHLQLLYARGGGGKGGGVGEGTRGCGQVVEGSRWQQGRECL